MSISDEIVNFVRGVTPYIISILFAFTITFCVIQQINIPDWFMAMLSAGAGSGVTGAIVSRQRRKE